MKVITDLLPVKRDNLGHPVILISISMVDFLEALCDFGSSVNIMPRVPYEKFFTHPLSETTMGLQLADRTLSFPKGNIEEPLRPSWYLVSRSTLHGDRDWYR